MNKGLFNRDMFKGYMKPRFGGSFRLTYAMRSFQSLPDYGIGFSTEHQRQEDMNNQQYNVNSDIQHTEISFYNK
jgi:hypothetical protein